MKKDVEKDPVKISGVLRVLQDFQKKLELDFPGILNPKAEIVIEKGKVADIEDPHKKAS